MVSAVLYLHVYHFLAAFLAPRLKVLRPLDDTIAFLELFEDAHGIKAAHLKRHAWISMPHQMTKLTPNSCDGVVIHQTLALQDHDEKLTLGDRLVRVAVGKVIAHVAFVAAVAISVCEVWGLDVILRTFTRRPRGRLAVLSLEATAGLRDTCTAVWAIHRLVIRTVGRNTNITPPVGVPTARFDFVAEPGVADS